VLLKILVAPGNAVALRTRSRCWELQAKKLTSRSMRVPRRKRRRPRRRNLQPAAASPGRSQSCRPAVGKRAAPAAATAPAAGTALSPSPLARKIAPIKVGSSHLQGSGPVGVLSCAMLSRPEVAQSLARQLLWSWHASC